MTLVAQVTIGLGLALLVNQRVRGLTFFRTAYFLPVVASFVVMAAVWKSMYAQSGIFNTLLLTVGLDPHPFLTSVDEALPSLAALGVWKFVGFDMLVFLGDSRQSRARSTRWQTSTVPARCGDSSTSRCRF